ncbi:MAG: arylsulfatase A-like enzyme [Gammaproteobacteria bacterium]
MRAGSEAGSYWLESSISAASFQPSGRPGVWRAPRPFPGSGSPPTGPLQTMEGSDGSLPYVSRMPASPPPAPGVFCASGPWVLVVRHPSMGPPGDQVLREYLQTSHSDGTHSRITIGPLEADGIALLPGATETLVLNVPPNSALSFWTTARNSVRSRGKGEQITFRVEVDGELLFEHEQSLDQGFRNEPQQVTLPAAGGVDMSVVFSVQGDPAQAAVLVPTLHPVDLGRPGARPWGEQREDIVLLQGDTFRADNLAAYGGDPRITPVLNKLAQGARVFTDMQSTATWTVPAHASLFTGLLPHQTGCVGPGDSLGAAASTLAELLRAAGYRTIAITDQGFVSRSQGFEQGFEWFYELGRKGEGSFLSTLEDIRAQLAVDDGRPLFLFVQSYRAHVPYAVSAQTRAALGEDLNIKGTWEELQGEFSVNTIKAGEPGFDDFVARARALYLGGVHDLDRGIESFMGMLEATGRLRHGTLLFTSDHGEAFGEHGLWGHGLSVYQEETAVPLLVLGANFMPGTDERPASLVDIPSTILDIAGLPIPRNWRGSSLARDALARTRYAVTGNAAGTEDGGQLAALRANHKLVFPRLEDPESFEAYDRTSDPKEQDNLSPGAPNWAAQFANEVRKRLTEITTPLIEAGTSQRSVDEERRLGDLGYGH